MPETGGANCGQILDVGPSKVIRAARLVVIKRKPSQKGAWSDAYMDETDRTRVPRETSSPPSDPSCSRTNSRTQTRPAQDRTGQGRAEQTPIQADKEDAKHGKRQGRPIRALGWAEETT